MERAPESGAGNNLAPPQPGGGKGRILVVEDEAIIAYDIRRRLEAKGYLVTSVVTTGALAVRKAAEEHPDLVLMDIVLPGELDGITAARLIRAHDDIPVVYLTAYSDESVVRRALESEPFGYIVKPFEESELFRTIEIGLYKHGLERRLKESEKRHATILSSIGEAVVATDTKGLVSFLNPAAERLLGWSRGEAATRPLAEIVPVRDPATGKGAPEALTPTSGEEPPQGLRKDYLLRTRGGEEKFVAVGSAPIIDTRGTWLGTVLAIRDVTAQRATEEELRRSREELKIHAAEVHERNVALKVLLEQRESDRDEFEEEILENVRNLVFPFLEKLRAAQQGPECTTLLDVVESNLHKITSAFSRKLSSRYHGLSPQEIRIANLIREGRQDKEIMEALGISFETVKTHRQNIRKKLGIYGTRENLRSNLTQFTE